MLQVRLNNNPVTLRKMSDSGLSVNDMGNSKVLQGKNVLQVMLSSDAKYPKEKKPTALDAAILLVRDTVDQDLQPLVNFCYGEQ